MKRLTKNELAEKRVKRPELWNMAKRLAELRVVAMSIWGENCFTSEFNKCEVRYTVDRMQSYIDRILLQDGDEYDDDYQFMFYHALKSASWECMRHGGEGPLAFDPPRHLLVDRDAGGPSNHPYFLKSKVQKNRALLAFSTAENAEAFRTAMPNGKGVVVQRCLTHSDLYGLMDSLWKENECNLVWLDCKHEDDSIVATTVEDLRYRVGQWGEDGPSEHYHTHLWYRIGKDSINTIDVP